MRHPVVFKQVLIVTGSPSSRHDSPFSASVHRRRDAIFQCLVLTAHYSQHSDRSCIYNALLESTICPRSMV